MGGLLYNFIRKKTKLNTLACLFRPSNEDRRSCTILTIVSGKDTNATFAGTLKFKKLTPNERLDKNILNNFSSPTQYGKRNFQTNSNTKVML